MTNLRVAMFLEMGTTAGGITGAYLSGLVNPRWLYLIFGTVLAWSALAMFHNRHERLMTEPHDALSERLALGGAYYDPVHQREIVYHVGHPRLALGLMYIAGILSGLLGIGAGILKVPTMDVAMRLPIKVSSATSNFMIGVTAAASAGFYFVRGDINPFIAAPVAAGILVGATLGSRLLPHLKSSTIRLIFLVALIWVSYRMIRQGLPTEWFAWLRGATA